MNKKEKKRKHQHILFDSMACLQMLEKSTWKWCLLFHLMSLLYGPAWGNEIRVNVWGVKGKLCLGCDGGSVRLHSCKSWKYTVVIKDIFELKWGDRISNTMSTGCHGAWWLEVAGIALDFYQYGRGYQKANHLIWGLEK